MAKLPSKLSDEQKEIAVERYRLGETMKALAEEFEVSIVTMSRYIHRAGAKKTRPKKEAEQEEGGRITPATSMREFSKRARSILWRQDSGKKKKTYDKWNRKIEELRAGGGVNPQQAIIQASKDFPCLKKLFQEYAIGEYDPHPDSHPDIHYHGQPYPMEGIKNEEKELSHRENLAWAIATAGNFLRTGEHPESCPNNAAFYLFRQALDEPKDFLGKFTQIEAKGDSELDEQRRARRSGQRSAEEIEEMLSTLTTGEE